MTMPHLASYELQLRQQPTSRLAAARATRSASCSAFLCKINNSSHQYGTYAVLEGLRKHGMQAGRDVLSINIRGNRM